MLGSEVRSWGWRHVRRQAEEWPTVWSKGKYSQNQIESKIGTESCQRSGKGHLQGQGR